MTKVKRYLHHPDLLERVVAESFKELRFHPFYPKPGTLKPKPWGGMWATSQVLGRTRREINLDPGIYLQLRIQGLGYIDTILYCVTESPWLLCLSLQKVLTLMYRTARICG